MQTGERRNPIQFIYSANRSLKGLLCHNKRRFEDIFVYKYISYQIGFNVADYTNRLWITILIYLFDGIIYDVNITIDFAYISIRFS